MKKRALMLTAAAVAVWSGHAEAASSPCATSSSTTDNCDITTDITSPLFTGQVPPGVTSTSQSTNGTVTIDTDGELVLGINPPTAPAITINSGTTTLPTEVNNTTNITYTGISDVVGVLLEEASVPTAATGTGSTGTAENWVGEYFSDAGVINLTGTGTGKTGILIAGGAYPLTGGTTSAQTGVYANQGLGVFTGATNVEPTGSTSPVAIDLAAGSTLEVQGDSSFGINLIGPTYTQATNSTTFTPTGGASLIGDIDIGGSLEMTPTTVGETAASNSIAVNIAGWEQPSATSTTPNPALAGTAFAKCACAMVGNINIEQGGIVSGEGAGTEGVVIEGAVEGGFTNRGELETFGTTTPSTALTANDPEAGPALIVSNNLTGGIFNGGPTVGGSSSTEARATISMVGNSSTLLISPSFNVEEQVPITIGGFTDTVGDTYSLLNRGAITAGAEDSNISNSAINITGQDEASVLLTSGIFNSGTISSAATTNVNGPTTFTGVTATAINIGNFVNIKPGTGGVPTGTSYALVNSDETGGGIISASIAGAQTGEATAILIQAPGSGNSPGNLSSIFNSGTISAAATTTTLTSTGIAAFGIRDESGTLATIFNNGTISAITTELDNNAQIADAIDTSSNSTTPVTITNESTASQSAVIEGDIHFGSLPGTLIVSGVSEFPAAVAGNIFFNNASTSTNDSISIGSFGDITGEIQESADGSVNVAISPNGTLDLLTALPTNINSTVSTKVSAGTPLSVGTLNVASGGVLKESLSQSFNVNVFPGVSVINAQSAAIGDPINVQTVQLTFGSFVSTPGNGTASFVLINTPNGKLTVSSNELNSLETSIQQNQSNAIPFLFTGTICAYNIATASVAQQCAAPEPISTTNSEIVLNLAPKTASQLGLTGFAAKMFPFANEALVNDNTLGAAMITDVTNQAQAQAAYASFAPDVSGATRAIAISLTDSATNVVSARQQELRMYANQEGDTTLWGQQFGDRLSQANKDGLTGYNDSGFGFVLGADEGDAADGRYGLAFTFFGGGMAQKEPTSAKTASEYYLLTGYSDWRGTGGLFLDSQATVGYGSLKGSRYLVLTDPTTGGTVSREADGNRPTEMLAGGVSTGGILTAGGTVFTPQFSLDGLALREEGYTEANGGDGFDLRVQPYYADSLRAFLGADIRQDVNFNDFYFQPELRVGYRYDFVDGFVKLRANFASVNSSNGQSLDEFTVEGPDPGHGNFVLGGGFATTTGAWSIGLHFDYVKAEDGPTEQTGVLTLVGRI